MLTDDDDTLDLTKFPCRVDAAGAARLVSQLYFPTTAAVVRSWPLVWRSVDDTAVCETADALSLARAKMDAAPLLPIGAATSELQLDWWAENAHAIGAAAELLRLARAKLAAAPQRASVFHQAA